MMKLLPLSVKREPFLSFDPRTHFLLSSSLFFAKKLNSVCSFPKLCPKRLESSRCPRLFFTMCPSVRSPRAGKQQGAAISAVSTPCQGESFVIFQFDKSVVFSDIAVSKKLMEQYHEALSHVNECKFENFSSNNYVEWMDNLFKYGGDQYAIQTIEYVLAKNYHINQLWKDYIEALKKRNMMKVSYCYPNFLLSHFIAFTLVLFTFRGLYF